jgi:hypothetical protein
MSHGAARIPAKLPLRAAVPPDLVAGLHRIWLAVRPRLRDAPVVPRHEFALLDLLKSLPVGLRQHRKIGVADLATVLDDGYVPLGGAADGLSRRLPGSAADEFMELFKTALFNGEFDDEPEEMGETGVEWLRTAAETCKRRYGFTRDSVVRMLLRADALPTDPAVRESLFDVIAIMKGEAAGYDVLARTRFIDYPERGQRELEALMVRRSVLASFLRRRYRVSWPADTDSNQPPVLDLPPANENFRRLIRKPAELRGRPCKIAWPRVVELARHVAREHPDWQRKRIAFEAWSCARDEFNESELPSVATIQRSMVEILDS